VTRPPNTFDWLSPSLHALAGGGNGGGAIEGLADTAMRFFGSGNGGSSGSTAAKLPAVPLTPEGEAGMKKVMLKGPSGKSQKRYVGQLV
jgi:hypothetical protein